MTINNILNKGENMKIKLLCITAFVLIIHSLAFGDVELKYDDDASSVWGYGYTEG